MSGIRFRIPIRFSIQAPPLLTKTGKSENASRALLKINVAFPGLRQRMAARRGRRPGIQPANIPFALNTLRRITPVLAGVVPPIRGEAVGCQIRGLFTT
jgi:hypothetical protein